MLQIPENGSAFSVSRFGLKSKRPDKIVMEIDWISEIHKIRD